MCSVWVRWGELHVMVGDLTGWQALARSGFLGLLVPLLVLKLGKELMRISRLDDLVSAWKETSSVAVQRSVHWQHRVPTGADDSILTMKTSQLGLVGNGDGGFVVGESITESAQVEIRVRCRCQVQRRFRDSERLWKMIDGLYKLNMQKQRQWGRETALQGLGYTNN